MTITLSSLSCRLLISVSLSSFSEVLFCFFFLFVWNVFFSFLILPDSLFLCIRLMNYVTWFWRSGLMKKMSCGANKHDLPPISPVIKMTHSRGVSCGLCVPFGGWDWPPGHEPLWGDASLCWGHPEAMEGGSLAGCQSLPRSLPGVVGLELLWRGTCWSGWVGWAICSGSSVGKVEGEWQN